MKLLQRNWSTNLSYNSRYTVKFERPLSCKVLNRLSLDTFHRFILLRHFGDSKDDFSHTYSRQEEAVQCLFQFFITQVNLFHNSENVDNTKHTRQQYFKRQREHEHQARIFSRLDKESLPTNTRLHSFSLSCGDQDRVRTKWLK